MKSLESRVFQHEQCAMSVNQNMDVHILAMNGVRAKTKNGNGKEKLLLMRLADITLLFILPFVTFRHCEKR